MSGIVCAIRGGPSSQNTIRTGIRLAQEREVTLYFLYVFNLNFLMRTTHVRQEGLSQDMAQMGEFILLMAQDRAAEAGVAAERVMRQGEVAEEIVEICNQVNADVVVLGKPELEEERRNVFTPERLQDLILKIEEETGAEVILANGGDEQ